MSAGRKLFKEFYVGFLLLMLSFLYLSHLNELNSLEVQSEPARRTLASQSSQSGEVTLLAKRSDR